MGFLDQIFRKKEVFPPVDLSILGADMHSHLIPRIDDGAQNIEQSILLIKSLKSFGFKKIITTPHIMSDYYKNTPDVINKGLDEVRSVKGDDNIYRYLFGQYKSQKEALDIVKKIKQLGYKDAFVRH